MLRGKNKKAKLPRYFKPMFWSYDFSSIDPEKNKRTIIVNSLNYGDLKHWKWLIKKYGRERVKNIITDIPKTAFFPRPLALISLLLKIKKMKYVSRSDYIQKKRNISAS